MNRIRMFAAAVILGGLCTGLTVMGQDKTEKKGPNVQDPVKGAKESDKNKALQDLDLASRLIQYGRTNKHAESLLIAAQILHNTPTTKLKVKATVVGEKKADVAEPVKANNSPKALVAEAKKLSTSAAVESLAKATLIILDEEPRGRLGGPGVDGPFILYPNQERTWNGMTFVGGQMAEVAIANGVYGRMILEVRDQFGNVVARDNVPGSFYNCRWTPAFTGPFTIRLTNLDTIAFRCGMATN